jgi:glycosyltransferase involved in cell wall biosynthesis
MVSLTVWLRTSRVGLVYAATSATAPAVVSARLARVDTVCAHVQEVWTRREGDVLGRLVGLAHTVVTISQAVQDALPGHLRLRALVVENGVDSPDRSLVDRPEGGPLRFLVASRWNTWKGHRTLLEAWDADVVPGELVIAGSAPASGDGVDVPAIVAGLKHPESVTIIGQVDSLFDVLDDVDVLVVPSDRPEPFGLVAIEAFSRGRAVIGSAAGGLRDIVDDGRNGMLFEPGNSAHLRDRLLSLTREASKSMGIAGSSKFRESYSAESFRRRMSAVWDTTSDCDTDGLRMRSRSVCP